MAVKRKEWIYDLSDETGFTLTDCKKFMDGFTQVLKEYLVDGKNFNIYNLGTFKLMQKHSQKVPTGNGSEMRTIPTYTYVHFTPTPSLKEAVYPVEPNDV